MVQNEALARWGKKLANCEVTPQAIWPITESQIKSCGPKAPSAIHGFLGPVFYPSDKMYNCRLHRKPV
jgi:hypothetical protein